MNIKNLNEELNQLIQKKSRLGTQNSSLYNNENLQEEIAILERKFRENYGLFLDEVLFDVYDEFCSDSEVKDIIQYIPGESIGNDGVQVECDEVPAVSARLCLRSDPVRLELTSPQDNYHETVWEARQSLVA